MQNRTPTGVAALDSCLFNLFLELVAEKASLGSLIQMEWNWNTSSIKYLNFPLTLNM